MIYLVDLEYVESRYTAQWKDAFPQMLANAFQQDIVSIEGPDSIPPSTSPGAFLNFGGTNIYKSAQVIEISRRFTEDIIQDGDQFVFADAWHTGILQLKYMAELLQKDITIHALWHAGSYDKHDFLGRLIGDKPWVRHTEEAIFHAVDKNYFASKFHMELFANCFFHDPDWQKPKKAEYLSNKMVRSGWPMEYLEEMIREDVEDKEYTNKKDIILFPHRIAPEKQVDIFKDLEKELPQYEFIVCQEKELTKPEYHKLLGEAKMVFSANLQETLGISCYEALCTKGMPLVPERLSYKEMYEDRFMYPSKWTQNWKEYQEHKEELKEKIVTLMDSYNTNEVLADIETNKQRLRLEYFGAANLYKEIYNNEPTRTL
tara:strand:- start:12405 stop:13523 length:1119 start_codon:yes stop_codon:yes gene_type:complete